MQSVPSRAADILIAWLERFELNELKNEKATSLADDVLLEISQRAEQARRRAEWNAALLVQTVPMILDYYEQEASPDNT